MIFPLGVVIDLSITLTSSASQIPVTLNSTSQGSFSFSDSKFNLSKIGFFPCTLNSWLCVLQQFKEDEISCVILSNLVESVYPLSSFNTVDAFNKARLIFFGIYFFMLAVLALVMPSIPMVRSTRNR